jgi:hypothetical protein
VKNPQLCISAKYMKLSQDSFDYNSNKTEQKTWWEKNVKVQYEELKNNMHNNLQGILKIVTKRMLYRHNYAVQ